MFSNIKFLALAYCIYWADLLFYGSEDTFLTPQMWWQSSLSEGKAVLLQDWSGPEGSRKLRFPDDMTTAQDGGKVVSPTHRPPLPPGNARGTHFC